MKKIIGCLMLCGISGISQAHGYYLRSYMPQQRVEYVRPQSYYMQPTYYRPAYNYVQPVQTVYIQPQVQTVYVQPQVQPQVVYAQQPQQPVYTSPPAPKNDYVDSCTELTQNQEMCYNLWKERQ